MGKKILVAYFSCSGVTKGVAQMLADAARATCMKLSRRCHIPLQILIGGTGKAGVPWR